MSDLKRMRGDTYADEFIIKSPVTGQPINITGYSFKLTVDTNKDPVDDTTNVYSLNGVIVDAANGRVEFSPSDVQADQIGKFYYDVQMLDGSGRKRTIVKAKYEFTQDITKT
ncbi:MAG: hypothetical protein BWZ07_03371 [Alphaproteobacteria bacterium ADurb.BinA280]|nr:MAG: hypothetical protein BWZ07_03371 [Alphaproteobacteria bacterium ADurb.BinA280]